MLGIGGSLELRDRVLIAERSELTDQRVGGGKVGGFDGLLSMGLKPFGTHALNARLERVHRVIIHACGLEGSYQARRVVEFAGGQISLVTMSGTNEFHGTLFEFVRNSAFDARNFFDQTSGPAPFKRNQFGGSAGAPIKKDRTFIFGNYEGFRQRLAVSQVAVVPDDNARKGFQPAANGSLTNVGLAAGIAPYFSLWPEPNGPELGGGAALFYGNPAQ